MSESNECPVCYDMLKKPLACYGVDRDGFHVDCYKCGTFNIPPDAVSELYNVGDNTRLALSRFIVEEAKMGKKEYPVLTTVVINKAKSLYPNDNQSTSPLERERLRKQLNNTGIDLGAFGA